MPKSTYADRRASLSLKLITRNPYRLANALTALCWAVCGLILLVTAANWPFDGDIRWAVGCCIVSIGPFWMAAEWADKI